MTWRVQYDPVKGQWHCRGNVGRRRGTFIHLRSSETRTTWEAKVQKYCLPNCSIHPARTPQTIAHSSVRPIGLDHLDKEWHHTPGHVSRTQCPAGPNQAIKWHISPRIAAGRGSPRGAQLEAVATQHVPGGTRSDWVCNSHTAETAAGAARQGGWRTLRLYAVEKFATIDMIEFLLKMPSRAPIVATTADPT